MNRQEILEQKQILIDNITNTTDVKKLEFTILTLIMGWTIDEGSQDEYKELIRLSVNRLKTLSIIEGFEHPLSEIDVDTDENKIKMCFQLSLLRSMVENREEKETFLKFSLN